MLALSGCTNASAAKPKPQEAKPQAVESPTPTPEPIVFPEDCEAMNPAAAYEATNFANSSPGERIAEEKDLDFFNQHAIPEAQQAMASAAKMQGCSFTVYFQNTVRQWTAEVPVKEQEALEASLLEAGYTKTRYGLYSLGAADYTLTVEIPEEVDDQGFALPGSGGKIELVQLFIGDVWISIISNGEFTRDYAKSALEALIAANPSLKPESSVKPRDPSECATLTGAEALAKWGPQVPAPIEGVSDYWDLTGQFSDVSGYDPCADLSWIILRETPCCTRFSPSPILLFHRGEFVQLATEKAYALIPEIPAQRLADNIVSVSYMYQGEGGNAELAEVISSHFIWDEKTGKVIRDGGLPPS